MKRTLFSFVALGIVVAFELVLLRMVRKQQLALRFGLAWGAVGLFGGVLALNARVALPVAEFLGTEAVYVILALCMGLVMAMMLHLAASVSRLGAAVRELAESQALLGTSKLAKPSERSDVESESEGFR